MMLNVPNSATLSGIVLAEVAAAALLALDRRARDRLGDGQQVAQVERRVPAGVVLAVAGDADARGALLAAAAMRVERLAASRSRCARCRPGPASCPAGPAAPCTGSRRRSPRSNGASAVLHRARRPRRRRRAAAPCCLRELRRVLAGALAEHEQVGQRVAAQAVGAVDARRRTRRRRTGPGIVDICVSASTRMPPMM